LKELIMKRLISSYQERVYFQSGIVIKVSLSFSCSLTLVFFHPSSVCHGMMKHQGSQQRLTPCSWNSWPQNNEPNPLIFFISFLPMVFCHFSTKWINKGIKKVA
jgi:hypothetical protein